VESLLHENTPEETTERFVVIHQQYSGGISDGSKELPSFKPIRGVAWSDPPNFRNEMVEANGSTYLSVIAPEDLAVWRFTVLTLQEEKNWRGISKRIQDCWNSKSFYPLKKQVIPWSDEQRFLNTEDPITNRASMSPTLSLDR
jgi:hypothetical protein